ncbi:LVIVD repeat-containing protein [Cytobacillus oceanisediminis]|uniref:LVIVD repeat-containing protein n=1 Tax=Cytobacillus oceanisediminis TaxID=665099 RepID=UPI003734C48F
MKKKSLLAGSLAFFLAGAPLVSAHDELSDEGDGKWQDVEGYEQVNPITVIEGGKNVENLKEVAAVPWAGLDGVNNRTADVYAHKGFAYVATKAQNSTGVRVFDMKDPSSPVEVSAFADDLPGTWQEKVVVKSVSTPYFKGDLAAVSVQQWSRSTVGGGTVLYDVSDPLSPKKLGFWELPESVTGTHELYFTTQGNRTLLLTANSNANYYSQGEVQDFVILDFTDPAKPTPVFEWDPSELESTYSGAYFKDRDGVNRRAFAHSVMTDATGNYAYVSFWDMGTLIFDISSPENAELIGRTSFERNVQGAAHSVALAKGGTVLIENREVFNPDPSDPGFERGWGYVRLYDIKDKSNPVLIGDYRSFNSATQIKAGERAAGRYTVHDPKVVGNTLYLSHYSDGVRMVDITDPSTPMEIGSYVPKNADIWGVFVDRNYILASDMQSGLKVVQKNNGGTAE